MLLLATMCALLVSVTARADEPTAHGALVRKLDNFEGIALCHESDLAFAWKHGEKGLFLVQPDGEIVNRDAPLFPDDYVQKVIPACAGDGAWLALHRAADQDTSSLAFVERCAKDAKRTVTSGLTLRDGSWQLWPSDERGASAWVEQTEPSGAELWWVVTGTTGHAGQLRGDEHRHVAQQTKVAGDRLWRLIAPPADEARDAVPRGLDVCDPDGNCAGPPPDRDGCLTGRRDVDYGTAAVRITPVSRAAFWTVALQDDASNASAGERTSSYVICMFDPDRPALGLHQVASIKSKLQEYVEGLSHAVDARHLWFVLNNGLDDGTRLYLVDAETGHRTDIPAGDVFGADGTGGVWFSKDPYAAHGKAYLATADHGTIRQQEVPYLSKENPYPISSSISDDEPWQAVLWLPGRSWIRTFGAAHFRDASGAWSSAMLPNHSLESVLPFSSRNGALVRSGGPGFVSPEEQGTYAIRIVSQASGLAEVRFADTVLDTSGRSTAEITCVEPLTASIKLAWPGADDAVSHPKDGVIELRLERAREAPLEASRTLRDGTHLAFENARCEPGTYTVVLQYKDRLGGELEIRWPGVRAVSSIWKRRDVRTGLAFLLLVSVALAFAVLLPHRFRGARWIPPLGTVLAGGGEYAFLARANIDFGWLAGLTAGSALILLVVGAVSPRLFRQLASIAPYDRILPAAMTIGLFRRRLLGDYVARLRAVLKEQRAGASDEAFFELPARIEDHPDTAAEDPARAAAPPRVPVDEIARALADPDPDVRAHVFIEAPAGRGKSALVRAVVDKLLRDFTARPSAPLPVLCPKPAPEVEKLIEDELLRDALSPAVVKVQLQRGLFVLVVDAVDEGTWQPDQLKQLIRGSYQDARVLVASRPSAARREVFANADRWKRVEPAPLDANTIADFERHYHAADRAKAFDSHLLTDDLRRICRTSQDGYSPLLVRFAMRAPGERVASVYSLYGSALGRLLRSAAPDTAEPLLAKAAELCEATLWRTGQREFTLEELDAKHRDVVVELRAAFVVVPVAGAAHRLRFFHSTVQSYLVARALAPTADGAILATAAGDPRFLQEWSDLLGTGGSDVFHFLIHARSPEVIRPHLVARLSAWCAAVGNDLARSLILGACPAIVDGAFQRWLGAADRSNSTILAELLRQLTPSTSAPTDGPLHAPDPTFAALVELFAAIAPSALALERAATARGHAAHNESR